jgi:hypothetical protein
MNLSDRRARTWPVLGVARTATDGCRLLRTRPAALAGRPEELQLCIANFFQPGWETVWQPHNSTPFTAG